MGNSRSRALVFALSLGYLVTFAGAPALLTAAPSGERELLIAAASDLRFAFDEMTGQFGTRHDIPVTISYGSSGLLTQQIENGAPFDLFFSANRDYVERIVDAGFSTGELSVYALGYLALVVPAGNALPSIEQIHDSSFEAIAIANPNHAPYGQAAREAITALGLYEEVEARLVYGDNVLDAMRLVETGNADVGIVSLAFLEGSNDVVGDKVDASLHEPIEQTAVVLENGSNPEAAEAFLQLVNGEAGSRIMRRYRFGLPDR